MVGTTIMATKIISKKSSLIVTSKECCLMVMSDVRPREMNRTHNGWGENQGNESETKEKVDHGNSIRRRLLVVLGTLSAALNMDNRADATGL